MLVPILWQDDIVEWPDRLRELMIDPKKTALVIVDVQNYGTFDDRVVENGLRLLIFFRERGLPVFFLRVGSMLPDASDVHIKRRITVGRHVGDSEEFRCPKGCWGFDIRPQLSPLPTEMVIDKNSSGAFNSTSIDHYLRNMGVQNLVITGWSTHACVQNTARDAADIGYNVILAEDACACSEGNDNAHRRTIQMFTRIYGSVKSTDQTLEVLETAFAHQSPNGLLIDTPALHPTITS